MIDFWILATFLLLGAIGFILMPLLWGQKKVATAVSASGTRRNTNIALYKEQLSELERSFSEHEIEQPEYQQLKAEYSRALLIDAEDPDAENLPLAAEPKPQGGRLFIVLFAILVPVFGIFFYLERGQIDNWQIASLLEQRTRLAYMAQMQGRDADTTALTSKLQNSLKARLVKEPGNIQNWYSLAQIYMEQKTYPDAAAAYQQILKIEPNNVEILGLYAQALYLAGNGVLNAEVRAAIKQALAVDPGNITVLGLVGISAYEGGDYQAAIDAWQHILDTLPPHDPNAQYIQSGITRAKEKLGQSSPTMTRPAAVANVGANVVGLSVKVSLADTLQVTPDKTVFIFARPVDGGRMPVAIQKVTVADLPVEVVLNDSNAAMPGQKLSNFKQVQLVARVSQQGSAMPQSGDLQGISDAVNVQGNTEPILLQINTVLP